MKQRLLLFDGHALVHRAFHALPPLSVSKTGEPTGAVYGFIRMLLKTVQDFQPTHWAVSFDRPTPTFRHVEFEDYKAQRPAAPDELRRQFGRVREVVEALGIPIFELDGYEADDVLGTIAVTATAEGLETIIVSGDNDMLQLVSPSVKVLLPQRAFGDTTLYDTDAVQHKYGVDPTQLPDFKGLKGDPSDNIPGVSGVGDKTATKLVQSFGSVEGIYERIGEVTPEKLRETLVTQETQARQGKRLATIVTDAPVDFDPACCQVRPFDRSRLARLFRELEFFTLADKLPDLGQGSEAQPAITTIKADCTLVETPEALEGLASRLAGAGALAIQLVDSKERPGFTAMAGIAIHVADDRTSHYVPVSHGQLAMSPGQMDLRQALDLLLPLLSNPRIAKLAHDGKSIINRLAAFDVDLGNLQFDTMIAAYLLGEKSLDLKTLAPSRLGIEIEPAPAPSLLQQGAQADNSLPPEARYACDEAAAVAALVPVLRAAMEERQLLRLFTDVEMPLVPVLARMERNGVALDTDLLRHMSEKLGRQLMELEDEIYGHVGHRFNINSPQQLGGVLFGELKLPGARKTKTGYSTNASVLEGLAQAHPIIRPLLEYRQLMKLKSTYVDALPTLISPSTGRVHTSFNQAATATGRLSSSDPNLQNIPIRGDLGKQVRRAFVAQPPCLLVGADYSQIELRILAHLSQDPGLMTAFRQDEDIHAATASEVFGVDMALVTPDMRRLAKVVNFGIIYGMSDYGLEQATELSRQEAAQFIASYFNRYTGVKTYLESTKLEARENGYVQTLLGRRRYIPEIRSPNRQVREAAERMAINMPVQGTAADIIKLAMITIQGEIDRRGLKSTMILQVHDDLLFEVPPEEMEEMKALIQRTMCSAVALTVPLKVDVKVGKNWGEMG